MRSKALALGRFFEFVIARYQGDIHAMADCVVAQPIDEFNRPAKADYCTSTRVPPSDDEVDALFAAWRESLPYARKYLPAARDYLAASLWRRAGLRINETSMLDIRDWGPDLGERGKLHVRFGKGRQGRGPKTRLVPGINAVDDLLEWWLTDVRHQYADGGDDPDGPQLPSERRDCDTGACVRVGPEALRTGFATAVTTWLPDWSAHLTPHGLRHFCASSLYRRGMDLKAIQELLGHEWLSTTTRYIHVHPTTSNRPGRPRTSASQPGSRRGDRMRWNLRLTAAERGIWKSTEMRRRLAEAGLEISAGKMSALWTGAPTSIRLDDLDVICSVLECSPSDVLVVEPDIVAARRPAKRATASKGSTVTPRRGRNRTLPPA